jgi:hypothetical protein
MAKKEKKIWGKGGERIGLSCACGTFVDDLTPDTKAVTCWICIARACAAPEMPKQRSVKSEEERPRGWQRRKEYIAPSGKTYSFGKEVTDDERIDTTDTISIERVEKTNTEPVKRKRGRPKGSKDKSGIYR